MAVEPNAVLWLVYTSPMCSKPAPAAITEPVVLARVPQHDTVVVAADQPAARFEIEAEKMKPWIAGLS